MPRKEGSGWRMAWPDILLPEFTRLLPFAAGAACCRTVRQYGVNARLKWVNDVLVAGKKLAGILCTTVQSPGGDRYHLLGIGINGNNQVFPAELQDTATCLRSELSRLIALTELTGRLLAELQWSIGLLHYDEEQSLAEGLTCGEGRASLLLTAWQELSDTVGQQVKYGFDVQQKTLYRAVAREIDPAAGWSWSWRTEAGSRNIPGRFFISETIEHRRKPDEQKTNSRYPLRLRSPGRGGNSRGNLHPVGNP